MVEPVKHGINKCAIGGENGLKSTFYAPEPLAIQYLKVCIKIPKPLNSLRRKDG